MWLRFLIKGKGGEGLLRVRAALPPRRKATVSPFYLWPLGACGSLHQAALGSSSQINVFLSLLGAHHPPSSLFKFSFPPSLLPGYYTELPWWAGVLLALGFCVPITALVTRTCQHHWNLSGSPLAASGRLQALLVLLIRMEVIVSPAG